MYPCSAVPRISLSIYTHIDACWAVAAAGPATNFRSPVRCLQYAANCLSMSAFGGARGAGSKPPEKGIFPLDHFGECKQVVRQYLECLKTHRRDAEACRQLSQQYLQCRMERDLMAKQDLTELGFTAEQERQQQEAAKRAQQQQQREPSKQ